MGVAGTAGKTTVARPAGSHPACGRASMPVCTMPVVSRCRSASVWTVPRWTRVCSAWPQRHRQRRSPCRRTPQSWQRPPMPLARRAARWLWWSCRTPVWQRPCPRCRCAPSPAVGPDGVSRSVERLAALAAGVMRKGSICVTAPEQPKAVLSELIVAAGKCDCELVVPDPEDITFLEAEKFASKVDYGGYTVPLAFLGRHAAGNAAMAVELALALCRKGFDIPDEAILDGLAAVENRSSIRVISQRPLVILDACRTPQQASALLRVLNMAKVRHMSAIIGLAEEEGAEAFFSALETGLTPEEQKKDKSTMPGMSDNPFDKVYLVTPTGGDDALTERLTEKAKFHFDAELCATLAEAVELAHANTRRGLLVCGSEAAALEAAALLENS